MAVVTITGASLAGGIPTGGAVGGASSLTTVGAIPYVTSSGVLGQDATALFWDAANDRLGVGTASPSHKLTVSGAASTYVEVIGGVSKAYLGVDSSNGVIQADAAILFRPGSTERARFVSATGNLLIGGTTDGNYKLDVQSSGSTGTLRVYDQTATTGSTLAVIQAGAGQSGNLLSVRNNAGTEVAGVDGTGKYRSDWHTDLADTSMALRAAALQMNSTYVFQWSSGGAYGNTKDLGLARSAAGILEINNGTAGTYRDLRLRTLIASTSIIQGFTTPASASDTGTAGQIAWDTNYIYIATGTNTWKRVAIATW